MKNDDLLQIAIKTTLESSQRYRMLAQEYMKRADDLEARALEVVLNAKDQGDALVKEAIMKAAEKGGEDVFKVFGEIFGNVFGEKAAK